MCVCVCVFVKLRLFVVSTKRDIWNLPISRRLALYSNENLQENQAFLIIAILAITLPEFGMQHYPIQYSATFLG